MEGEERANQGVKNEVEMNLCDPHQQWGVCWCGHTRKEGGRQPSGGTSPAELPIVPHYKPQIVQMQP